ncbi:hypothetical protein FOCC_FOCC014176 [Frankliniella occidentalis]|uniref:Pre-rRNA-processing protein TSR2 homolog n=1 Tax=Frankliniella occidentalis TaxID=133901 RepID=A0A6J1SB81_FRAOC|nr:pre-rRNA-processing protein TSR2 homolog [Frankliniella occidentalis]KAE8740328.1 hypothetical protein FOCC_FOCC014176 [Frankliniella occidentalis]
MSAHPEELFRHAAGRVFNTWTALQLAVEHGMGGSQSYAKAMGMVDAAVQLFRNKPDADWQEVADLLGDMMDDEFNTICEDDSTDEVGLLLWEFYRHCSTGDRALVESEMAKLPPVGNWLSKCINQTQGQCSNFQEGDEESDEDEGGNGGPSTSNGQHPMNNSMDTHGVDPDGWTQVHRRRK